MNALSLLMMSVFATWHAELRPVLDEGWVVDTAQAIGPETAALLAMRQEEYALFVSAPSAGTVRVRDFAQRPQRVRGGGFSVRESRGNAWAILNVQLKPAPHVVEVATLDVMPDQFACATDAAVCAWVAPGWNSTQGAITVFREGRRKMLDWQVPFVDSGEEALRFWTAGSQRALGLELGEFGTETLEELSVSPKGKYLVFAFERVVLVLSTQSAGARLYFADVVFEAPTATEVIAKLAAHLNDTLWVEARQGCATHAAAWSVDDWPLTYIDQLTRPGAPDCQLMPMGNGDDGLVRAFFPWKARSCPRVGWVHGSGASLTTRCLPESPDVTAEFPYLPEALALSDRQLAIFGPPLSDVPKDFRYASGSRRSVHSRVLINRSLVVTFGGVTPVVEPLPVLSGGHLSVSLESNWHLLERLTEQGAHYDWLRLFEAASASTPVRKDVFNN